MTQIIILLFCIGYILIATEKAVQINKAAVALLMGIGCLFFSSALADYLGVISENTVFWTIINCPT